MNEPERLDFRVVSGPNLGALVSLSPGRYVVGSAETCDLIMADDTVASRHLALVLTAPGDDGLWRVTVRPLGAKVLANGQELPADGQSVPSGQVIALGLTALVWFPPGADWGSINQAHLQFFPAPAPVEAGLDSGLPLPDEDGEAPEETFRAQTDQSDLEDTPDEEEPPQPSRVARRPPAFWLGLLVLFILLGLMLHNWSSAAAPLALEATALSGFLSQNGFGGLSVQSTGEDLVVEGSVASDAELAKLVAIVKKQPFKTYLRITVQYDMVRATYDALGAYGFYPAVSFQPRSAGLSIAAYMRNQLVEARAFEDLARDVPGLIVGARHIVHADEMAGFLGDELKRAGLSEISVTYLDGRIELTTDSTSDFRQPLDRIFRKISDRFKAPVDYTIIRGGSQAEASSVSKITVIPSPVLEKEDNSPGEPAPRSSERLIGDLQIDGVTLTPMRFITTRNGHRLFEGSVLSNGYVITEITADEIRLNRDGQTAIYLLRSSHD
jgi:type III secretion protein D